MIEVAKDFNIKSFVNSLCRFGVTSNSKEIAAFLESKGVKCSWQMIAGIKAANTKSSN